MQAPPTHNSQSKQLNPTAPFPSRETPSHETSTETSSRPSRSSAEVSISPSSSAPLCSSVPSVVNELPQPLSPPLAQSREISDSDNHPATVPANLNSIVIKNLLASPFLAIFYTDSLIPHFPNSNAAKILARYYPKKLLRPLCHPSPRRLNPPHNENPNTTKTKLCGQWPSVSTR